jgi:hypothetical protein
MMKLLSQTQDSHHSIPLVKERNMHAKQVISNLPLNACFFSVN